MGNLKMYLTVGILAFIGWLAASFVSGFVNGLLYSVFPFSGSLALVGTIIGALIFCLILGFLIVILLRKFA